MVIDSAGEGGGAKRLRGGEQGDRCEALAADVPVDRISALPDELRLRILARLTYKDAIRTGALASGWRDLWRSRWTHRASVKVYLGRGVAARRELDALEREPRPRRRLERFSLVAETCKLNNSELKRFLEYAAECHAEDLQIEMRTRTLARKLTFRLPLCSPLLARLSLRDIGIANRWYKGAQPFRALEVIQLCFVSINPTAFKKMMSLCPNLLTLDLRRCYCDQHFGSMAWPATLRSVTVAHCNENTRPDLVRVHSLRSFRYRGSLLLRPFLLAGDAVLSDLYICFSNTVSGSQVAQEFNKALPDDLSALTVLTICNIALPVASSLYDDGATTKLPKLHNLHGLRELHLLMFEMEEANLADIYVFLKTCKCHNLERLFVQLICGSTKSSLDVAPEETPEDGLDNLAMVKVKNFNWRCAEVQLVSFLLRKAKSLRKLLIVSENVSPLDVPGVQAADLLFIKEALANGKIMLSKSDDAATHPYHSAFISNF